MSVSQFTQPDYTSQTATQYKTSLDDAAAVFKRIAQAFAPHAQSTPDMTIKIDAGFIPKVALIPSEVAAQNTGTITAPSTNPRKDIVYIDQSSGAVGVATGAEAASPSDPAVPAGKIAVARINLGVSQSSIINADITDLRNLGLVGLGSSATLDVGMTANDIVQLDGSAKLPAVDGSQLTNLPASGASDAEKANIKLNAIRIAALEDGAFKNQEDGIVDAYTDESGVDTVSSTNQTYDATNNLYKNSAALKNSSSGLWSGATASFVFSGADVASTATNVAIKESDTWSGDFEINFTLTNNQQVNFGVYESSEDAAFSSSSAFGGMNSMTNSWYWNDEQGKIFYAGVSQGALTIANGSVIKLERISGTFKLYVNGAVVHTWTQTSTNAVRMVLGVDSSSNMDIDSLNWTDPAGTTQNMTLISQNFSYEIAPTIIEALLIHKPIDVVTLNTDLTLEVSRNGGTNYTLATLTDEGVFETGVNILRASIDVSGQATPSNIKYRLKTLNAKEQEARGIVLGWS
ncbi:hypothetical protein UR09_03030 [Candidatus Nitromaritima sp. SCGC AAA799-A02]|nr:hypothetical protein UR09_03030 [Candidatus Nitromaritima sp. SCGC AAA799-A02]